METKFKELRHKKNYVSCPVCGRPMLRCDNGLLEAECRKCNCTIVVIVRNDQVITFKSRRKVERDK